MLVAAAAARVQEEGFWPLAVGYWLKQSTRGNLQLVPQSFPSVVAVKYTAVAVVSLSCRGTGCEW
jgi:hypothetical protein